MQRSRQKSKAQNNGVRKRSSSAKCVSRKQPRRTKNAEMKKQTDVRTRSKRPKSTFCDGKLPETRITEMKQPTGVRTRSSVKSAFSEEKLPETRSEEMNLSAGHLEVDDILSQFYNYVQDNSLKQEECIICCEILSSSSPYSNDHKVISLQNCHHKFHLACLKAMYSSGTKDGHLQCPICKTIYGIKKGIQPEGTMNSHVMPCSLPGYPNCDTICIIYNIPPGIQGPEHIHPGRRYNARGFPRVCYLPNNDKGKKVLRLLKEAWERRLIFTIGVSATTGEEDTVTWNEIHHKTEFMSNFTGHGWPDPQYLDNVLMELALQGVTE